MHSETQTKAWLLVAAGLLPCCGNASSDGDRFSTLDRLRVLAIRSEPADIAPGEKATLDALVYVPPGSSASYAWSWCPARADASGAFECTISEDDLRQAWTAAGIASELPPYDLGSDSSATWTHSFSPENLARLCSQLSADEPKPDEALVTCIYQMAPSLELVAKTSSSTVTALRTLPLWSSTAPAAARNKNPILGTEAAVREMKSRSTVATGQPLFAGQKYVVTAPVDALSAETFLPVTASGIPPSVGQGGAGTGSTEPRKETLVLSWFVTKGHLIAPGNDEGFDGGGDTTSFVDGSTSLDDLSENGWQLPRSAASGLAQLVLVLRDERGGVTWRNYDFQVEVEP